MAVRTRPVVAELRGVFTGLMAVAAGVIFAISVDLGVPGQALLGSLRFHIAIALLLLPIALFVLGAWWRGLLSLLLIGASLAQGIVIVAGMHEARAPLEARTPAVTLSVMSYNVLADNATPDAALDAILARRPDFAVIMETPGIERHLDDLSVVFPWRAGCQSTATCDLSILSRLPLSDVRVLKMGPYKQERMVIAKAEAGGVRFTIVGLHLTKPYYDGTAWEELRYATQEMSKIEGPIVLAGDFNAAAWSDSIAAFASAAALVPPPSHPATWPVELGGLGVPIDNMFTRGPALIRSIAAQPPYGSNHLGLLATVDLFAGP